MIEKVEDLLHKKPVLIIERCLTQKSVKKADSQESLLKFCNFSSITASVLALSACNSSSVPKIGETYYATIGNATLKGGPDQDTVSYSRITTPIEADLTESAKHVTFGNYTHTLIDIENIIGTEFNDIISNSTADSIITGGGGCDTFKITWGLARITDLETCDVFIVDAGAQLIGTVTSDFIASVETISFGTVELASTDIISSEIDMRNAAGGEFSLIGGSGSDILTGGTFNDILVGGAASDTFNITSGVDVVSDLTTGDILIVSLGATANATNISNFIATSLTSNGGVANLTSGNSGSIVTLTNSAGGAYNLLGGSGTDLLTGATGSDTIDGKGGDDTLTGGGGNDTFKVTSETDLITDLTTGDVLIVSLGATANATNISNFIATSLTSNGGVAVLTSGNSGSIVTLTNSTSGAYSLIGGSLADFLTGGNGADGLFGVDGNDTLDGGIGNDTLTGGSNDDHFKVTSGTDIITDLSTGDILNVFAGATANATDISHFIATSST